MASDFEQILDMCVDRVNRGEKLEACMADYPQYASQLEPLLRTMFRTEQAFAFTPSPDAKRAARQRFLTALEKQRRPSFWQNFFSRRSIWMSVVAAVLVILVIGYVGLRTALFPSEPSSIPSVLVASPLPNGNFVFLVTDEVNAIDEFSKLDITVNKVALLQSGDSPKWVEFVPEVKQFDLTQLPDGITSQLWQGDVPEGQYSKARLYISQAQGTLKSDRSIVDIKIPSDKVQFDIPTSFDISSASITSFTYDLTVFNTGKGQGGEKYQLKPQSNHSSVHQEPRPSQDKSKGKKSAAIPDTLTPFTVTNDRKK